MDEKLNYVGAMIFWLYILAALFFTAVVVYTLLEIPPIDDSDKPRSEKAVKVFGVLASISFTTLSVNMLLVLLQSFAAWFDQQSFEVYNNIMWPIWRWSLESTLFRDFGEAIVENDTRYVWAQLALHFTLFVCLEMGVEGRMKPGRDIRSETDMECVGQRRGVPRLWAFFSLSQILPISFTQNLFYIALLRLPNNGFPVAVPMTFLVVLVISYGSSGSG